MFPVTPPLRLFRLRDRLAGAAFVFSLAGCTLAPAAPAVTSVEPGWGYNGESTDVEIVGENFFPTVVLSEAAGDDARIESTFQAWLMADEPVLLSGVSHIAYDRLRAEVPEGIEPGTYDLRVRVPSGLETTLEGAFKVTDTRADHLDLEVATVAYVVGDYAEVGIFLQDPADQAVEQALEVVITATSESGAKDVSFSVQGLDGQETLDPEEGVGVRGTLGGTGMGKVLVTSVAADDVTIEVAAADNDIVRGDSQKLTWEAGPIADVELVLPRDDFRTRAGDEFDLDIRLLDVFGNVLSSDSTTLLLSETCGDWSTSVTVVGEATVSVTLEESCEENQIRALSVGGGEWTSDTFDVLPGDHAGYAVQAAVASVEAGTPILVFVEAVDGYGNLIEDHDGVITLTDDVDGLDPERGLGEQSCPGFSSEGVQLCTATLWSASDAVTITAADEDGVSGDATPIEVLPADAETIIVVIGESTVVAGAVFEASVRALDPYGNSVEFDPAGSNRVVWEDDSDTIECEWTEPLDGAQMFDCTIEGAIADANVTATVLGLQGAAADPLTVENGALADVEVEPQGSTFVAGTAFTLELSGYDAYGNAYLVQSDPRVDIDDTAGTMSPASGVLGSLGTVQVSAVVYGSGSAVRVYASQGGTRLGVSRALVVTPAEMDGFAIDAPPWIVVDEPTSIEITAVDAYDNPIEDYAGTVTLVAQGDSCDAVELDGFEDGAVTTLLECSEATLSETLAVSDDTGFEGGSGVLDVVDLDCTDGPTADLALDGGDQAIQCLSEGGSVTVDVDTSGSAAGASAIAVRHFVDGEHTAERTLADGTTYTYEEAGTRWIETLVADTRACADLVGGYVFVGMDDGEPTGPVEVSVSDASPETGDTVTVTVSAWDCTEDVAAGQALVVRADLGTPAGTSTGEGLEVTLDAAGTASFLLEFDTGYAGNATVYAGSASGGAVGAEAMAVTGDTVLPEVVSVAPSGLELGTVEVIVIVFSEAMHPNNLTDVYVALTGPSGAEVDAEYDVSSDNTTLTITPDTAIDGSAGRYTLSLSQNLRDAAGNKLDGGFADTQAPFSTTFGDVADSLPEVSSCELDPEQFVPDGDDGVGDEADATTITPTSTTSPTWWWLIVEDASGARVRSSRVDGTESAVAWDARGDDGIVAASGEYKLTLSAIDGYGNVGEGCDATVELQQHVEVP